MRDWARLQNIIKSPRILAAIEREFSGQSVYIPRRSERVSKRERVEALWRGGKSLQEIARAVGYTTTRVRQLVRAYKRKRRASLAPSMQQTIF